MTIIESANGAKWVKTPHGDYPYRCSMCKYFRQTALLDNRGNQVVSPDGMHVLIDIGNEYCVIRSHPSMRFESYLYRFSANDVDPYNSVPNDCARFELPLILLQS